MTTNPSDGVNRLFNPESFQSPHCNADVLHAPGRCVYCDHYPERQRLRSAAGTPFTPDEANGWSGNTAVPAGEPHSHMGSTFVAPDYPPFDATAFDPPIRPRRTLPDSDGTYRCDSTHLGYQCEGRIREGDVDHLGLHHFGAQRWSDAARDAKLAAIEPPERPRKPRLVERLVSWMAER